MNQVVCQMISGTKKNKSKIFFKIGRGRKGLTNKVAFEQRSEGGEGASHEATQQKALQVEGAASTQALEQEPCLRCAGPAKRPLWLG